MVAAPGDTPQLTEQPEPKVGPDTVLVRVKVAGVNPVDWKVAVSASSVRRARPRPTTCARWARSP
ncbi:hypothetical protein [Streptomyces sp. NPDC004286]|uniref:hypothetical protein n=1 Tax=Streptomyces sp. NPDC004286 TaxID=3364696 RepID=UPI0036AB7DF1